MTEDDLWRSNCNMVIAEVISKQSGVEDSSVRPSLCVRALMCGQGGETLDILFRPSVIVSSPRNQQLPFCCRGYVSVALIFSGHGLPIDSSSPSSADVTKGAALLPTRSARRSENLLTTRARRDVFSPLYDFLSRKDERVPNYGYHAHCTAPRITASLLVAT